MDNEELSVWYNTLIQLCDSVVNSCFDKKTIYERALFDFNEDNRRILEKIFSLPGISFAELQDSTNLFEQELSARLDILEEKGLVAKRNFRKKQMFLLTKEGIDFCKNNIYIDVSLFY